MSGPTALRRRLSRRLEAQGITVDPDDFYPATSYFRSSSQGDADTYRWEASGSFGGLRVRLYSWDTMTRCARFGVVVAIDGTAIDVSAIGPASCGAEGDNWAAAVQAIRKRPKLRAAIIDSILSSMAFEGFPIDRETGQRLLESALTGPALIRDDEGEVDR